MRVERNVSRVDEAPELVEPVVPVATAAAAPPVVVRTDPDGNRYVPQIDGGGVGAVGGVGGVVQQELVTPAVPVAPIAPIAPVAPGAPVAAAPVVTAAPAIAPERHMATVRVASESTIMPAAGLAGLLAVALLVFGGVAMARAGFEGAWRDPVVEVGGFTATALLGVIVASAGLVLLCAALARAREAILLFAIVIGVGALIAAIEPTVGDGALAIERGFAVLVAIACGVVVLVATVVSTIRRTASRVERI